MKRKFRKRRIFSLLLCIILLLFTLSVLSSCGRIKDLTPYREEFIALIEASYEVNDILFGAGLPVYSREDCLGQLYYTTEKNAEYIAYFKETVGKEFDEQLYADMESKFRLYHWIYRDPILTESIGQEIIICKYSMTYYVIEGYDDSGNPDYDMVTEIRYALRRENASEQIPAEIDCGELIYTTDTGICYYQMADSYEEPEFEYEYSDGDNKYYDVVRLDCGYTTIDEIKALAEKVYSEDYLEGVYSSVFDGIRTDFSDDTSTVLLARFIEEASDGEDSTLFLRQSNITEPLFESQHTYDFSTMKIRSPYSKDRVNVTIEGYGTYYSTKSNAIVTEWHTVKLSFVLENGQWRLDSPTY